jgi:hypothetical protein
MSAFTRFFRLAAVAAVVTCAKAADAPKDSPFAQAGTPATATAGNSDTLEFAGVSVLGQKTMINLYDRQAKSGFWVQEGQTASGVTVVKYDAKHDQVTVRRNGTERTLPLRPPGAVVNGPAAQPAVAAIPITTPPVGGPAPATTPAMSAGDPNDPQVRAHQEEEARMLVSDLLEIGMAQRKAYEEAQRRAASGQNTPANATPPPAAPTAPTPAGQPTQAVTTTRPSGL